MNRKANLDQKCCESCGLNKQRSRSANFLDAIEFDRTNRASVNSSLAKYNIDKQNKRNLINDLNKILGQIDNPEETFKPSISTINKMFEALERLSLEVDVVQKYYRLISNVLRRCVYCKVDDIPHIIVEQIQIRDQRSPVLTAKEIPYYNIYCGCTLTTG